MQEQEKDSYPVEDVFKYFDGGRDGVKKRFADQVRTAVSKLPWLVAEQLFHELELSEGVISGIVSGDLSGFNYEVIDILSAPLELSTDDAFGRFGDFPEAEQNAWMAWAREEGFCAVAGCNDSPWPIEKRAKLFVLLTAYRLL